ncbi:dephospho-CoA kinase [Salinispira pacifica]
MIGITGKYCAGKNRVAALMEARGYRSIDVDRLGHEALELERGRVRDRFGGRVVTEGGVDRRALGAVVFADPDARRDLEAIVHPRMVAMVKQIIERSPAEQFCINAAILYRMGLNSLCDAVLWVYAPAPVRLYRAFRRDHTGLSAALHRMRSQSDVIPPQAQHSGADVDIMKVRNVCGAGRLERAVDRIVDRIRDDPPRRG